jgi:hypothetical protein
MDLTFFGVRNQRKDKILIKLNSSVSLFLSTVYEQDWKITITTQVSRFAYEPLDFFNNVETQRQCYGYEIFYPGSELFPSRVQGRKGTRSGSNTQYPTLHKRLPKKTTGTHPADEKLATECRVYFTCLDILRSACRRARINCWMSCMTCGWNGNFTILTVIIRWE